MNLLRGLLFALPLSMALWVLIGLFIWSIWPW